VPSGAKARVLGNLDGTTEVVPFPILTRAARHWVRLDAVPPPNVLGIGFWVLATGYGAYWPARAGVMTRRPGAFFFGLDFSWS
jgi:hypothetical protein